MTTKNPRVLGDSFAMPPFPFGGLKDLKQTEDYLRKLATVLASDRTQVGDRVERRINHGPVADRPSPDGGGNVFYSTDTEEYDIDVGTWENIVTSGGISDHGGLTGLDDPSDHDWAVQAAGDTMIGELIMSGVSSYLTQLTDGAGLRYTTGYHYNLIRGMAGNACWVGDAAIGLELFGVASRPQYNSNDLALLSDFTDGDFTDHGDTPSAYPGYAGYGVGVNSTPDALEFVRFVKVAGDTMTGILEMSGGWLDLKTQPTTPVTGIVSLGRTTTGDVFRMATVDGYMDMGPTPGGYCMVSSNLTELVIAAMDLQLDYAVGNRKIEFENSGSGMRTGIEFDGTGVENFYFGDASVAVDLRGSATRPTYNTADLALYSDLSGYLPLSAGDGFPLTGDLYFGGGADAYFTNNNGVFLQENIGDTYLKCFYMGSASNHVNVGNTGHSMRIKGDETRPQYNGADLALLTDAGGGPGVDTTAIHDNVANEIYALVGKTPVAADVFIIENSADSWAKRKCSITTLSSAIQTALSGPWLPLTAGASNPVTGNIYIEKTTPAFFLDPSGATVDHSQFIDYITSAQWRKYRAAGQAAIYLNPVPSDGTSAAIVRLFINAATTGPTYFDVYDGAGNLGHRIIGGGPATFCKMGGSLYVDSPGISTIRVRPDGGTTNYTEIQNTGAASYWTYLRTVTASIAAVLNISAVPANNTSNATIGIGYQTDTTGARKFLIYDGTAAKNIQCEFNMGTGDIDLCNLGGEVSVNGGVTILEGILQLKKTSDPQITLAEGGALNDYTQIKDPSADRGEVRKAVNSGIGYLDFDVITDATSEGRIRFNRWKNSTGDGLVQIMRGDGSSTSRHEFSGQGDAELCRAAGNLTVGGSAGGQRLTVVLGNILIDNNYALVTKEVGGTQRHLIGIGSDDDIDVGDAARNAYLRGYDINLAPATDVMINAGSLKFDVVDEGIWFHNATTYIEALHFDSTDSKITLGNTSATVLLKGGYVYLDPGIGGVRVSGNTRAVLLEGTAAFHELLKIDSSNVAKFGSASLELDIQATTAINLLEDTELATGKRFTMPNNTTIRFNDSGGSPHGLIVFTTASLFRIGDASYQTVIRGISSAASDPTTSHFATGQFGVHKNTSSGVVFFAYNDGGSIVKVPLA